MTRSIGVIVVSLFLACGHMSESGDPSGDTGACPDCLDGAAGQGADAAGQGSPDGGAGKADSAKDTAPAKDVKGPEVMVLPTDKVMAFPGAEGFGADTVGGRGGKIYEVTTLADKGPGSLRSALSALEKRIVVFRVSGTITLESDLTITSKYESYVTVAGQTSPGGIQIKGQKRGLTISNGVHDVVIRHLRIRPGSTADPSDYDTNALIGIQGASNVVIDHCSLQWGQHVLAMVYGPGQGITFQWNIIGEGDGRKLGYSLHILGSAGNDRTITAHHNLIAHSTGSQPLVGQTQAFDFRNNLVYDWPGGTGMVAGGLSQVNFVNNYYAPGPNSDNGTTQYLQKDGFYSDPGDPKVFTEGNWTPVCPMGCADDWTNFGSFAASQYRVTKAFTAPPVATQSPSDAKDAILFYAGASRPVRDSLDAKIVSDVMTKKGFDNSTGTRGPWPTLENPAPPADKDHDGMSDDWEKAHGLNPDDAADGPAFAKNGFTNVENYLNELAGDPIP